MDRSHPLRVTFRQIFIDRHDMNTLSCQRIQINSHDRCQGLTFTGLHLRNVALLHNGSTDQLYMIRVFADHSAAGFTCCRKCFGENVIQCLTGCQTFLQLRCHCFEFVITQLTVFICQIFSRLDLLFYSLQLAAIRIKQGIDEICHKPSMIKTYIKMPFYYT